MKVGDIVRIYAPVAGYKKYHFCVCLAESDRAGRFLYLNSDPDYRDCLSVDCDRIPMIPRSRTGVTAISFSMMIRYTSEKLHLYEAESIGTMPADVVIEMLHFVESVRSLPAGDKALLKNALSSLADREAD